MAKGLTDEINNPVVMQFDHDGGPVITFYLPHSCKLSPWNGSFCGGGLGDIAGPLSSILGLQFGQGGPFARVLENI